MFVKIIKNTILFKIIFIVTLTHQTIFAECFYNCCDCCECLKSIFKNDENDDENKDIDKANIDVIFKEEEINDENNNGNKDITKANIYVKKNQGIIKKYDLDNPIDLNNIDLTKDLENIFIQLLSERLYNYMTNCSFNKIKVYKTEEDKNNNKTSLLNLNKQLNDFILPQVKEFLNKKKKEEFFKDITLLDMNTFNNINDVYIKLLATFFLSDEDYENYITEGVDAFLKDPEEEYIIFEKDIFQKLSKDNEFLQLLGDHEGTNMVLGEKDAKTLSEYLKIYPPFEGKTFRGTGIYDKETGKRIDIKEKWEDSQQIIMNFIEKIKKCIWEESGVKPYTSAPYIAGYFAMNYSGRNDNFTKFKIFIHNHNNKTGVEIGKFYDRKRKNEGDYPLFVFFPEEEEVLCPINSKFKILGIQLGVKETYCRDKYIKYYQPFLVLDVIQIE